MFYVYWIYESITDNIYSNGYIGITSRFKQRFYKHRSRFGGYFYQVIFTGSKEQAFALEKLLRPEANIGWNKAIGGLQFGIYSPMTGCKHSLETIEKIRLGNLGKRIGIPSPMKGKSHSIEVKERLRIINLKRKHRPESKLKVSEALKKRIRKQETFDKISKAAIARYDKKRNEVDRFIINGNYIGSVILLKNISLAVQNSHSVEIMSRKDAEKENIG